MRLNRVICILNKLGSDTKTAYHSLFESHLQYSSQLWGQKNNETTATFQTFQNRALRKIKLQKKNPKPRS